MLLFLSADKTHSNIVFVCKSRYVDCFIKELVIDNSLGNSTYIPTTLACTCKRGIIGH